MTRVERATTLITLPVQGKSCITIVDVARKAGVSKSTVSRVLRADGDVSLRAQQRVADERGHGVLLFGTDKVRLGTQAAQRLIDRIEGVLTDPPRPHVLPVTLIAPDSVASVSSGRAGAPRAKPAKGWKRL